MNTPSNDSTSEQAPGRGAVWFIGTSLVGLGLCMLMLAGRSGFLLNYVVTGHGMAWMTLLLYLVALPGIIGAIYWTLPWLYRMPLFSEAFVWLHLAFHLIGTVLAVMKLFWPELPQAAMGQTFLAGGAVIFAVNVGCTLRQLRRPDAASAFFVAAMVWMLMVLFMGAPFGDVAPFPAFEGTPWSAGWLLLMVAGVFLNGIMGISMRLTPLSVGIDPAMTNRGWYALSFINVGLGWMFAAVTLAPIPFLLVVTTVFLTGCVLFWMEFFSVLQLRKQKELTTDARILLSALSMAPLAAAFILLAGWQRFTAPPSEDAGVMADAEMADAAGPLPVEFLPVDSVIFLTAMLGVVIPGIVALIFQFLKLQRDPGTGNRFRIADQILLASFFNYATGVLMVVPAVWVGIDQILALGTLFLVVGALGFLGTFIFAMAPVSLLYREENEIVRTA